VTVNSWSAFGELTYIVTFVTRTSNVLFLRYPVHVVYSGLCCCSSAARTRPACIRRNEKGDSAYMLFMKILTCLHGYNYQISVGRSLDRMVHSCSDT